MQEKGTISIHTENIFPIIKKFLYSDTEIFLRELVSNAVDATQKIKRLASLGQYNGDLGLRVAVILVARATLLSWIVAHPFRPFQERKRLGGRFERQLLGVIRV